MAASPHWCFTMLALALSGCGGQARSAAAREGEPQQEPAWSSEPSAASRPAAAGEPLPLPMEPVATPTLPEAPSECRGVVGATGRLAIEVRDQAQLDALAGCSTIVGDLTIEPFAGVDLRPLAALRSVQGTLTLGSLYEERPQSSFPSLDGLEGLESVAALSLRGLLVPSLQALGGLRHLAPFADQTYFPSPGLLSIDFCSELTDLAGLERFEGLTRITLRNNARLTSLRGLQFPQRLEFLDVSDSPVADLGQLSRVTEVGGSLWFHHTALQSAAGFERLARVEQLQFWGNAALRDLSALSGLTHLDALTVSENPELETLPVLDGVQHLTSLSVSDNAKLRELPHIAIRGMHEAWIERNASLERVLSWSGAIRAGQLRVADNPRLSLLDLSQLQELGELWVTNNPALDDTALRRLESVEYAKVRIAGNLGQRLPLAECPWTGDGSCDEVVSPYGVCAEGTDPDCVGLE